MNKELMETNGRCRRGRMIVLCLLIMASASATFASTVRGRLERRDVYGKGYVAAHIRVVLVSQQNIRSTPAYSGNDGLYYLYNVPPGLYILEVSTDPNRAPLRFKIQVNNQSVTDIGPIVIP